MISKNKKYYKTLTKDLKASSQEWFSYKDWETKTFKVKGALEMCKNGLHLYKSLGNLSLGTFGERVFEARQIGEYISSEDKICCREVKLIKEIKPEKIKDSEWAYYYCYSIKDKPEVYKNITDFVWAYNYCRYIKDRPEVCKHITDSRWACKYCRNIEDRPEVHKYITD